MYEKFEKLLELKGVRVADVCAATGIAQSTFADWKSGRSKPKIDKLIKIADYFGVSTTYFYGEDKDSDIEIKVYLTDPNIKRMVLFAGGEIPVEEREKYVTAFIQTFKILKGEK